MQDEAAYAHTHAMRQHGEIMTEHIRALREHSGHLEAHTTAVRRNNELLDALLVEIKKARGNDGIITVLEAIMARFGNRIEQFDDAVRRIPRPQ